MQDIQADAHGAPLFAGFWRRSAAFAIDLVVLAALGWMLGVAFHELFSRAGAWGRLIGFAVAGAVFVPLECAAGGGRSIGKRLLGLRVATLDGLPLSAPRAAARYAIFGVPYFLNGAPLPSLLLFGPGVYLVSLLVFGVGGASLYLFLFDRRTRRTLHDRFTGSVVLRNVDTVGVAAPPLWRTHRIVVGALFVFAIVAPLVMRHLGKAGPFAEIATLYDAVGARPEVRYAGVSDVTQTRHGLGSPSLLHVVAVTVVIDGDVNDLGSLPETLAGVVFAAYPDAASADLIAIEFLHGYDIGLSSHFVRNGFVRQPEQWRDRIAAGAHV